MLTRRTVLLAGLSAPLLASPAFAMSKPKVYATGGVAINGFDPVAYFTQSKPVKGSSDFTTDYDGATWQLASAANRDAFAADPKGFAPQYGGYCAYAVSRGSTAKTSPNAWTIHEGKLYLNLNRAVRAIWSRDVPGNIAKGDANWPSVLA